MSDLLELAMNAHGGLDRWREIKTLDLRMTLTGGLFRIKGYPEGVPNVLMHIDTQRIAVDTSPWTGVGTVGHFVPDRVWITDGERHVVEDRSNPRASFAGHVRTTPWDQLQRLYFTSYALWNYLSTPFLFTRPGFELRELDPHQEGGYVWRRLLVKYPPDVPTHSNEQTCYFDEKGLLQRVDYVTDVLGGIAAHYCYDHISFGGIVFPTLRRVVTRNENQSLLSNPTAVLLLLSDIFVR
jgi:hypothetical protein